MDNLFPQPLVLSWLKVYFKEMFVATVRTTFNAKGAKEIFDLPTSNQTSHTKRMLRKVPPKVGFSKDFTLVALYDTDNLRMVTSDRACVTEYHDITKKARRVFLEKHLKFKLALAHLYSYWMDAVDKNDSRTFSTRMMIQSHKWHHYPDMMVWNQIATLAYTLYVLVNAEFTKVHK